MNFTPINYLLVKTKKENKKLLLLLNNWSYLEQWKNEADKRSLFSWAKLFLGACKGFFIYLYFVSFKIKNYAETNFFKKFMRNDFLHYFRFLCIRLFIFRI